MSCQHLGNTVPEQLWSGGAGEARSGGCGWPAGAREVIGEPDDVARSLIGGPGCGRFPGDVEGRGSAAGRRWAEPAAGADEAAAAGECVVAAVTSSPSCDLWWDPCCCWRQLQGVGVDDGVGGGDP